MNHHIVWVHQSEILDSREFSEPGEILLTVGLNLPNPPAARAGETNLEHRTESEADQHDYQLLCDRYIRGMYEAGVLACGFGIGVKHQTVPEPLIEAAQRNGLPLFEVPFAIPFQAIEKRVSKSLADDEYAQMRTTYTAQRRLIAAAMAAEDPTHSVILRTAESVGGWAAFLSPDAEVMDISHIGPRAVANNLGLEFIQRRHMQQDRRQQPKTMFFLRDGRDCCIREVFDTDQRTVGFVVAGIPVSEQSDMTLRSTVMVASELLSVGLAQRHANSERLRHLRSTAIRLIARGNIDTVRQIAADLWAGMPQEPVTVEYVKESPANRSTLDTLHTSLSTRAEILRGTPAAGQTIKPQLFGYYDGGLWILHHYSDTPIPSESTSALPSLHGLYVGRSSAHVWEDITQAFSEARVAQRLAEFSGLTFGNRNADGVNAPLQHFPEVSKSGISMIKTERIASLSQMDLINPSIATIYSQALLRPLLDDGNSMKHTRQVLLQTLQQLVECSFNSAQCAERLNVHRHTIENRMTRIQQLLGLDFRNIEDTSRIWFAVETLKRHDALRTDTFMGPVEA